MALKKNPIFKCRCFYFHFGRFYYLLFFGEFGVIKLFCHQCQRIKHKIKFFPLKFKLNFIDEIFINRDVMWRDWQMIFILFSSIFLKPWKRNWQKIHRGSPPILNRISRYHLFGLRRITESVVVFAKAMYVDRNVWRDEGIPNRIGMERLKKYQSEQFSPTCFFPYPAKE